MQELGYLLGDVAGKIGKGFLAGLIGTAAMTVSSTIETKLRGREASAAPAQAAGKVLGVQPRGPEEHERFSSLVHWGYGTGWGGARGVLAATGLSGWTATILHFGAVWGASLATLPALKVAPPPTEWGTKELGIDVLHHAVYALTTGVAYQLLDRP